MIKVLFAILITLAFPVYMIFAGCVSSQPTQNVRSVPTSQPADVNAQQVSGGAAVGIQADTKATGVAGNLTGYNSEFGIGPAIIVGLSLIGQGFFFTLVCVMLVLLLRLLIKQSHEREMERLACRKAEQDG